MEFDVGTQSYVRGDVWYYECECGSGSEQRFNRPCVIVSNDKANTNSPVITIVPLTSKTKKWLPTHTFIDCGNVGGTVLCEQVITVSKDRLTEWLATIEEDKMKDIEKCLAIQLGLGETPQPQPVEVVDKEKVRLEAERDIYKELYLNSLK